MLVLDLALCCGVVYCCLPAIVAGEGADGEELVGGEEIKKWGPVGHVI